MPTFTSDIQIVCRNSTFAVDTLLLLLDYYLQFNIQIMSYIVRIKQIASLISASIMNTLHLRALSFTISCNSWKHLVCKSLGLNWKSFSSFYLSSKNLLLKPQAFRQSLLLLPPPLIWCHILLILLVNETFNQTKVLYLGTNVSILIKMLDVCVGENLKNCIIIYVS